MDAPEISAKFPVMTVNKVNRISLVAGYDDRNIIHDYTIFLLENLAKISDVYYLSAADMPNEQLAKLDGIVKWAGTCRHGRYDFGSWSILIERLGWDKISHYDELILVNDSIYGPMFDLAPICDEMTATNCDFWGMTASWQIRYHLQSFFLAFKQPVLADLTFRHFWTAIKQQDSHRQIVKKYEIGLSRLLLSRGYTARAISSSRAYLNPMAYPTNLLSRKFPFVKVKCFKAPRSNLFEKFNLLEAAIKRDTNYDFSLIERHLGEEQLDRTRQETATSLNHICQKFWFIDIYTTPRLRLRLRLFGIKILSIPLKHWAIERISKIKWLQQHK